MDNNPAISKGIDWLLVWIFVVLSAIGILSIFAATYREGDDLMQGFFAFKTDYSRQLLYFAIAGFL
ncbi:MAG: rod shape-determining protein RodA, partial [Chitinophagaceae bacterium]